MKNFEVLNDIICAGDIPEVIDAELSHEIAVQERWQTNVDSFSVMLSKAVTFERQEIIDGAHKVLAKAGYPYNSCLRLRGWLSEDVK